MKECNDTIRLRVEGPGRDSEESNWEGWRKENDVTVFQLRTLENKRVQNQGNLNYQGELEKPDRTPYSEFLLEFSRGLECCAVAGLCLLSSH